MSPEHRALAGYDQGTEARMLQVAARHREAWERAMQATLDEPRCRWYWNEYPNTSMKLPESEWPELVCVSVSKDGDGVRLHGHLAAGVDRSARTVDWLAILAFQPGSLVFGRDLQVFVARLVLGGWERIGWNVTVGNPAEAMYDRLVQQLNGRVVGIQRRVLRCRITGRHLDRKLYEVLPGDVPQPMIDRMYRLHPEGRAQ